MTPSRKLLILDLDETLVHATNIPLAHRAADCRVGFYHVYERPGVHTFLLSCMDEFTVAVWTSGSPAYAQEIVAHLWGDRAGELLFVWASDRGSYAYDAEAQARYPRKNLTKVRRRYGWPLESILVVDDTPQKWEQSYGNLVRVSPFEGDPTDDELPRLLAYLQTLRDTENVRAVEKRGWQRKVTNTYNSTDQHTLRVGDLVRVLCVPPMWYDAIAPGEYDETTVVLERCVGRFYPVTDINEYDQIVINCHDDGSPCDSWCHHTFYLERIFIEILANDSKTEEIGK